MKIRLLYCGNPAITLSCDKSKLKAGKSATLTVTFDPAKLPIDTNRPTPESDATPLNLDARAMIVTNTPAKPATTLRLTATVKI